MKSRIVAIFENCEIFSTYYFAYVRDYKAALRGGNKLFVPIALAPLLQSVIKSFYSSITT